MVLSMVALALMFVATFSVALNPFSNPSAEYDPFGGDNESIFDGDINWMASTEITRGCNPPANDRFCPDDDAKRGTLAAFMGCSFRPSDPSEPGIRIRVLTYNIHHGEGVDDVVDLERVAAVINSVSPDLVSLQQVERNTERTGGVDQTAILDGLTSMEGVFGHNLDFGGGGFGNAIL